MVPAKEGADPPLLSFLQRRNVPRYQGRNEKISNRKICRADAPGKLASLLSGFAARSQDRDVSESLPEARLLDSNRFSGVYIVMPGYGPAGFCRDLYSIRPGPEMRGDQIAQALSVLLSQCPF